MKVLITHASAGAGHQKAAEAIYGYFKKHRPDIDTEIIDVLDLSSGFLKFSYTSGYNFLIRYATFIWAVAFWFTSVMALRAISRANAAFFNNLSTKKYRQLLIQENAEYIISTHFLSSEIAANLKRKGRINSKVITIVTDFGVHPFWLSEGTDTYIVTSAYAKGVLIKEGVSQDKIKEFGIPVDEKFTFNYDRSKLGLKLGIDPGKFTVLVMTGSFGLGPIEETVEALCQEVQIIVVCARNKKLFNRLRPKQVSSVKVFGFVDNIQELMAVSDCIVTKPGGLSISELLSINLAPIFISAIPGQESINEQVLKSLKIGVSAKDALSIKEIILDYKNNPEKLALIKKNIRDIRKPSASEEILNAICSGSI